MHSRRSAGCRTCRTASEARWLETSTASSWIGLGQKLDRIEQAISRQGHEFGKEINGAAAAGHRGRV